MGQEVIKDRISNLPEEVRHHILSFLSTTDALRTCTLSSAWRYVWVGLPFLDFGEEFWKKSMYFHANPFVDDINLAYNNGEEREEEGNLIDYADCRLRTGALGFVLFIDQIIRILKIHPYNQTRKFRLFLPKICDDGVSMDIAFTNGDELHGLTDLIQENRRGYRFKLSSYLIASSKSLIELNLKGFNIFYTTIEFPSLRKFSMDYIDELVLEHLQHSCSTTLEELAFYCSSMKSNLLRVYGFPKLRVLQIRMCYLENLKIDAPDLHSLSLDDLRAQCSVNCTSLRNLVKLKLDYCNLTNGFFDDGLANFARLESLHIAHCFGQTHLKIWSKSLTNLVISSSGDDLTQIEIDTPNLKSFSLSTEVIASLLCKSPTAPQNAFIFFNHYSSSITENTKWLTQFVQCQTLAFYGPGNEGMVIHQELRESSSPLLWGVQSLHIFLNFARPPTMHTFLQYMDVVLQLSPRPKTFVLSTTRYVEEDNDWNLVCRRKDHSGHLKIELEFQYKEEIGEDENSCGCYPGQPINCWRHSLTGFKIKKQERLRAANVKKFFEDVLAERRKQ